MTRYHEDSGLGNHILCKMCKDFPSNNDSEVIAGKLWIIGRADAAAVERKAGPGFDCEPLKAAIATSVLNKQISACRKLRGRKIWREVASWCP